MEEFCNGPHTIKIARLELHLCINVIDVKRHELSKVAHSSPDFPIHPTHSLVLRQLNSQKAKALRRDRAAL